MPTPEKPTMTPSITYLHLLRHTPFFTGLDTDQLRWVIAHSREWEVRPGGTIASSTRPGHPDASAGYWVLLDGGWTLRVGDHIVSSRHADPGKWFDQDLLGVQPFALVATEHSYVMHIARDQMDDMLARRFAFGRHLDAGRSLYRAIVQDAQQDAMQDAAR
ncbi:hypothetical protein CUPL110328_04325 [Cupriavidus plantarum]|nr:hypothetical protein C7418_1524 [Cupriavidus plantarum]CAG2143116.1 hypothetical protein LMG26296_03350 [Cupriavidus plantarum]SMR65644.1 hypothetical protein SAMN05421735_0494 [Cupriavidus plantarum]